MEALNFSWVSRRRPQAGFVLPLAVTASAVLLLGSASIHMLSLQKRLRIQATSKRELASDQLRSSAQAFSASSRGEEACLLQLPSFEWSGVAHDCSGSNPSRLSRGLVGEISWWLLDWKPSIESGHLILQLADGRTGSFRLALDPSTFEVNGISDVQLQGRVAQREVE